MNPHQPEIDTAEPAPVQYREIARGRTKIYRVGSDGSAWSSRDGLSWRRLNPSPDSDGYPLVWIDRRSMVVVRLHVAVLTAFSGPDPEGREACHRDDNKLNNSHNNLYWGSRRENARDAVRNGRLPRGEAHYGARLSEDDVREILRELGRRTHRELAARYGVDRSTVSFVASGRSWGHVTGRTWSGSRSREQATPPAA